MNEYNLTAKQKDILAKRVADLHIQSMLFSMDIDWELLTLREKDEYRPPEWLTRWKEKQEQSDYMPDGSDDQEYDDERY